jgi:hypothetical protein
MTKQPKTKNHGCIAIIGFLILISIALKTLLYVTDWIEVILSEPIVYYGIPIVLFAILYIKTKNHEKEK